MTIVPTDANCSVAGGLAAEPKARTKSNVVIIVYPGARQRLYEPTARLDSPPTPEEEDIAFLYACRPRLADQLDRESGGK